MSLFSEAIQRGTRAAQPAANTVIVGTLYFVTDEGVTERSNGTSWDDYSDFGVGGTSFTDEVLVEAAETSERLTDRIIAGTNVTITELAEGSGDAIQISASGGGGDASATTYTPADNDKWNDATDPGATSDALDQLAKRLAEIERGQEGTHAIWEVPGVGEGHIFVNIDGGGSAITTGVKGDLYLPFGLSLNWVTLIADQSGSIVIDIWNDTLANYPPTDADSITASDPPTLSGATNSTDTNLGTWTTNINGGTTLRFNVDSATTVTRVQMVLGYQRQGVGY